MAPTWCSWRGSCTLSVLGRTGLFHRNLNLFGCFSWLILYYQSQSVFTGGEDGFVRAWKPADGDDAGAHTGIAKASRPKDKKQKERFKPY
jgi:hypothetical protein